MTNPDLAQHVNFDAFIVDESTIKTILAQPTTITRTKEAKAGSTDSASVEINESKPIEY